jgi:tellurite resistance protein TerC
MADSVPFWTGFILTVTAALAFDLFVMGRKRQITVRASLWLTAAYVVVSLLFGGAIAIQEGADAALTYLAAYVLEKSLSLDNIFLFLVVFRHFQVPHGYEHRVLVWGVMGALVLRGILIFAGLALVNAVQWVIYLFGLVVILSGVRLLTRGEKPPELEHNRLLRFLRRHVPMTQQYHGRHFFVRTDGKLFATPLFAVILLIESTDLLFALDSIPAVFGISRDPFIVYTSNVFAILGLRALYFALAGVVGRFHYLHHGLALVLVLIGTKMLVEPFFHLPTVVTMLITLILLTGSIAWSIFRCGRKSEPDDC